jgi:hypothetical protein
MALSGRFPRFDRGAWTRGGLAGAAVLLVAALVLMVNYLGWKYHHRFDWTAEQLYTLSPKTENVLAALDRDVEVVVLLSPNDEAYEPAMELLARYEAASPHLSVRTLDPGRNPLEAQRLAEEYDLAQSAVVFDDGEDRRVVSSTDLTEYDFSAMQMGGQPEVAAFRGEPRFTQALLDLVEGERPRVLFTTGHGEISLDDRSQAGLGEAQRILGDDNFELEEWASLGAAAVPDGTDLVVIAGPTSTFLPPELELFTRYLEAGGRMLVLLDPPLGTGGAAATEIGSTGLEEWLLGYGVDAGDNVVVDPSNPLPFFGAETLYATRYPAEHPVTRSVRQANVPVLVSLARSVGTGDVPEDLAASVLLETSSEGWGETDLEDVARSPQDLAGPVPLGVVVEGPEPDGPAAGEDAGGFGIEAEEAGAAPRAAGGGEPAPGTGLRLVVFGDSTFATDQLLGASVANAALLADALNWLVEREAALGIPPKRPEQVRLTLTGSQLRWTWVLALLALPGLAVVAGVFVHFRRRR